LEVLEQYISPADQEKLKSWSHFKTTSKVGHTGYVRGARKYRRRLGEAQADESGDKGYMAGFNRPETSKQPSAKVDQSVKERLVDMDYEGVDVNFMLPSGWFGTWTVDDDVSLEIGMHHA